MLMFAQAEQLNVFHDHHLVVGYIEHRAIQQLVDVHAISRGEMAHGLGHTVRRADQSVTLWIFPQLGD